MQADHANIRSAYSIYQIAQLEGGVTVGNSTTLTKPTGNATYYFNADGTLSADGVVTNAYKLQASVSSADKATKCAASAGCNIATGSGHQKDNVIAIVYTQSSKTWSMTLNVAPSTGSP